MTLLRLPILIVTLLISGNALADLRTYDVDPVYRDEIYDALRRILEPLPGVPTYGRVQLLPTGQVLVNAEPATLEQVEKVLQAIRARPATAAPAVTLRYWAVLGTRPRSNTEGPIVCAAGRNCGEPSGSPPPAALNDVLSELRRLHGDLTFRVIGSAAVTSYSGQLGQIKGASLSVEQTAHVQGNTMNATISMELRSGAGLPIGNTVPLSSLALRTTLNGGEFVVLGESHLREEATGVEGPVFYIVYWEK
jgi:hypothetical protein